MQSSTSARQPLLAYQRRLTSLALAPGYGFEACRTICVCECVAALTSGSARARRSSCVPRHRLTTSAYIFSRNSKSSCRVCFLRLAGCEILVMCEKRESRHYLVSNSFRRDSPPREVLAVSGISMKHGLEWPAMMLPQGNCM